MCGIDFYNFSIRVCIDQLIHLLIPQIFIEYLLCVGYWPNVWIATSFILAYSLTCLSYFELLNLSLKILAISTRCLSPADFANKLSYNYSSHWGTIWNRIEPDKEDSRNQGNVPSRLSNSYSYSARVGYGTNLTRQDFRQPVWLSDGVIPLGNIWGYPRK